MVDHCLKKWLGRRFRILKKLKLTKKFFTEFGEDYGSREVSYKKICRLRKKFLITKVFVIDAAKFGRPVTVTDKSNV